MIKGKMFWKNNKIEKIFWKNGKCFGKENRPLRGGFLDF